MKEKTYERLRELAIIDAKRRLRTVEYRLRSWDITDRTDKDKQGNPVGKIFLFQLGTPGYEDKSFINLSLNEYAIIREIKYIVWRFEILKEELELNK